MRYFVGSGSNCSFGPVARVSISQQASAKAALMQALYCLWFLILMHYTATA